MDIFSLGIPNIRIVNIGSRRDPLEIVEATITLEAWDGYLVKRWENGKAITDGTIKLHFACNTRSTADDWQTEINAYNYLLENQYEIRDNIIKRLIADFETLKETYYLDPQDDPGVPNITAANKKDIDLRPFIGPNSISITEEIRDDMSYVEWFLNCTWDVEHGLAAVTHKERVIDLDRGETDIWKIFADNGTLEEEQRAYELQSKNAGPRVAAKAWWKFW